MMPSKSKAPNYPKSHLLAASGVAALLSLALLVFPSREVEAKKTFIDLQLQSSSGQIVVEPGDSEPGLAESPFATTPSISSAAKTAELPEEQSAQVPAPTPDPLTKTVVVANGDTLSTVFAKVGLSPSVMHAVLSSSKDAKEFSRLRIGQSLEFQLTELGELASLRSKLSSLETLALEKTSDGYTFKKEQVRPDVTPTYARGEIDSSLFLAAKRAGLSHNLTMDLANVFGYDIDFALDIRKGDSFEVIYEEKTVEGRRVGTGNILAARFTNRGKTYSAVRYTNKDGVTSYYNADGTSMRKAFIRTPVDFARISSRFSNGRKHPILNKIRAHKGVDYAAPHGTPIKSAGDGKVLLAGRKGGYGNTVIIQHGQRYRTLYAHMQGFAKGVRNGSTVKQGQIIGYIGTTGLSTGPHLHYEFQVDGVHVDPLGLKLPMADPIAQNEKQRFMQLSQPLMARMDEEKATVLALNQQ
ncbi:peptidase M23 [Stutzerimonas decontaminans]|jgi:murein DD-endopeptidase MepM/ murein hydrolase activator NlpD|uniref:Peptidase M23 n=2 Tax=Stutzerimonas TaxID=2901164 RepID=A0ABX4VUV9_9GAMM|nr:peptidoglycan DD-metalloendopeptidase family protein [Stutzerimonas decontaminans]AHY44326.1 peptidase M23 [Stutzerimonas decontaminans]MCQ4244451.1 peptidoglycan DD-metalloendopeptidase family protein [Stutzerimonas decontaminans]MCW8158960.1 peptidase M23 [Stutzerimonas stutzeri]PNF83638.1 peptidase M23 [Stutzerimonas decontaminans]